MLNLRKEGAQGTRRVWFLTVFCAFLVVTIFAIAVFSPRTDRPSMLAQAEPTATTAPAPAATATIATTSTVATVTTEITGTVPVAATEVATDTASVRPTPSGPPPDDPYSQLTVFGFLTAGNLVAKTDRVPSGGAVDNVLLTITEARLGLTHPVTEEVTSALGMAVWDPVYYSWVLGWQSAPISGTARLLQSSTAPGGWNGGALLGTDVRVIALRTTTLDGAAHLQLSKWNKDTKQGDPLRMLPVGGGAEQDAIFNADLDVNMADLNDDGVYEVIADNVAGVQVWRWDGSKYVPEEAR
ncbi:MAG: hypothetical protein ABIQ44_03340 [Chloroflexia bacterium]